MKHGIDHKVVKGLTVKELMAPENIEVQHIAIEDLDIEEERCKQMLVLDTSFFERAIKDSKRQAQLLSESDIFEMAHYEMKWVNYKTTPVGAIWKSLELGATQKAARIFFTCGIIGGNGCSEILETELQEYIEDYRNFLGNHPFYFSWVYKKAGLGDLDELGLPEGHSLT